VAKSGKKDKKDKKDKKPKRKADQVLAQVAHTAGLIAGVFGEGKSATITPTRDLFSSIQLRRSHKRFKPGEVDREKIAALLDAAILAPNHKMTEPWGFLVLGPQSKRAYAEARARLKFTGVPESSEKALKLVEDTIAIPVIIAVTQNQNEDPVRREEDYAAVFMAVQNILLAATALGLGSKLHTGDILNDGWLRDALHVNDRERIVTFIDVGEPLEEMASKKRVPATEKTRWLL
jgi:nitroreductase